MAAHLVAFALLTALAPAAAVRRTQARFSSIIARRRQAHVVNRENDAKVLRSAHRRPAADVV
jgi:hypothetical protein